MSASAVVPGPRSALDEGTIHDLCVDCAHVVLPQGVRVPSQPAPVASSGEVTVEVPDDARQLLDELPAYGT